ncbi:MAG TPA: iron-sulfur cluster assembly protein [Stellaceae bacterium]|nr:iron-sulfur cluster assembly protein [Stellaceae bacterium]
MTEEESRDYFAFTQNAEAPEERSERPEGEDDLALMGPVLEALKTVRDPEIPVNLVDLGLIYDLVVKKGGAVFVEMTLTTPSCPVAASMPGEVEAAIRGVEGVEDVCVNLVWTPTWTPERMSEEAKLELGML